MQIFRNSYNLLVTPIDEQRFVGVYEEDIYRNNPFNEKLGLKRTWNDFNGYHTTLTLNTHTVVTLLS